MGWVEGYKGGGGDEGGGGGGGGGGARGAFLAHRLIYELSKVSTLLIIRRPLLMTIPLLVVMFTEFCFVG